MATYKGINGTSVVNYAGDLPNVLDGQVWYDSTNKDFKFQYENTAGAWSTGGNLNTARYNLGHAGTQTAALAFGGEITPVTAVTESYNGSSWTEVNDMNTARHSGGSNGTQTSALYYGGANSGSKRSPIM